MGNLPFTWIMLARHLSQDRSLRQLTNIIREYPSCSGGRSRHWFAEEVTSRIEGNSDKGIKGSRQIIAEFINAGSEKEIHLYFKYKSCH